MKKKYLISICLFISVFQTIKAQSLQDSVSVILTVGTDNKATLYNVKTNIQSLTNINYIGFCNNQKVFLVYVDPSVHGTPEVFLSTLIKTSGVLSLKLKTGTIKDILQFCEFNDPIDYNKNKLSQGY